MDDLVFIGNEFCLDISLFFSVLIWRILFGVIVIVFGRGSKDWGVFWNDINYCSFYVVGCFWLVNFCNKFLVIVLVDNWV